MIANNFVHKEKLSQPGVIAFVSQWRSNQRFYMGDTFFSFEKCCTEPDSLVIQCLLNYARRKKTVDDYSVSVL
jgi:hypothetical protein